MDRSILAVGMVIVLLVMSIGTVYSHMNNRLVAAIIAADDDTDALSELKKEVEDERERVATLRAAASAHTSCVVKNAKGKKIEFAFTKQFNHNDKQDPPMETPIVSEFDDSCLQNHGSDRFKNPTPWNNKYGGVPVGWGNLGEGPAFLVLDLCKMGHQPKDATLLHAVLQERSATPVVLFGNRCMLRNKATKKKGTWHILRRWFDVSIGISTKLEEEARIVYIDDYPKGVCAGKFLRRPHKEAFRWFRTSGQASNFRRDFLNHFEVVIPPRDKPTITLIRRGIERHFDEDTVYSKLLSMFGDVCNINYVQFDGDGNPAGQGSKAFRTTDYNEQLRILSSTDILIAGHGAALSSIVALPSGAVVLEAFPHNFRYHMYAELAMLLSLVYVPIESLVPWRNGNGHCSGCKPAPQPEVSSPHGINGLKHCSKECTPPCKKCDIRLDWERWEPPLMSALYHVKYSVMGSFHQASHSSSFNNQTLFDSEELLDELD
eukprot:TRINITY_DN6938_c0_g1_i2.p1 TRINITY_DN6938_c0_g1~~TRINITY_DN6938_c0_g1_i2.p1  ORF type:complete len:490 (+),score=65.00 TRINITY_DN6938_c0_g1_i2:63-1532(+)